MGATQPCLNRLMFPAYGTTLYHHFCGKVQHELSMPLVSIPRLQRFSHHGPPKHVSGKASTSRFSVMPAMRIWFFLRHTQLYCRPEGDRGEMRFDTAGSTGSMEDHKIDRR